MTERILVVEDDPRLADMLSEYLGQAGFRITVAPLGRAALERLSADEYDAVVLDLMLPDMDGLDPAGPSRFSLRLTHVPQVGDQIRAFRVWNCRLRKSPHDHARPGPHAGGTANECRERGLFEVLGRIHGKVQVRADRCSPTAVHLVARKAI